VNVDSMRKIDHLVGVPLCWLVSQLRPLFKPFCRARPTPTKVLLIELSEMGSAILVDPALRHMQAQGAELYFLIFAANKVSLDLLATIPAANVVTIRSDGLGPLLIDTVRFLLWAWRTRIDTVIDLELFSRFTALLAGLCGAAQVVGYHRFHNEGLYRGEMLTRKVQYNPHIHITRNFFSLVEAAWSARQEYPPAKAVLPALPVTLAKAAIDPQSRLRVAQILRDKAGWNDQAPLVLINANASDLLPQRRWPRERFAQLVLKILQDAPEALVLLTGSPSERAGLDELCQQIGRPRCVNLAGDIRFLDLLALYDLSRLMVTNDSGPAHFAAVTQMPTVVLFGPETPQLYGSLGETYPIYAGLNCSPCVSAWNHRKTPCSNNICLQAITVEQVLAQVWPLLGKAR
jgi:ADP-heptose:LPS heptosyltransferase